MRERGRLTFPRNCQPGARGFNGAGQIPVAPGEQHLLPAAVFLAQPVDVHDIDGLRAIGDALARVSW